MALALDLFTIAPGLAEMAGCLSDHVLHRGRPEVSCLSYPRESDHRGHVRERE